MNRTLSLFFRDRKKTTRPFRHAFGLCFLYAGLSGAFSAPGAWAAETEKLVYENQLNTIPKNAEKPDASIMKNGANLTLYAKSVMPVQYQKFAFSFITTAMDGTLFITATHHVFTKSVEKNIKSRKLKQGVAVTAPKSFTQYQVFSEQAIDTILFNDDLHEIEENPKRFIAAFGTYRNIAQQGKGTNNGKNKNIKKGWLSDLFAIPDERSFGVYFHDAESWTNKEGATFGSMQTLLGSAIYQQLRRYPKSYVIVANSSVANKDNMPDPNDPNNKKLIPAPIAVGAFRRINFQVTNELLKAGFSEKFLLNYPAVPRSDRSKNGFTPDNLNAICAMPEVKGLPIVALWSNGHGSRGKHIPRSMLYTNTFYNPQTKKTSDHVIVANKKPEFPDGKKYFISDIQDILNVPNFKEAVERTKKRKFSMQIGFFHCYSASTHTVANHKIGVEVPPDDVSVAHKTKELLEKNSVSNTVYGSDGISYAPTGNVAITTLYPQTPEEQELRDRWPNKMKNFVEISAGGKK